MHYIGANLDLDALACFDLWLKHVKPFMSQSRSWPLLHTSPCINPPAYKIFFQTLLWSLRPIQPVQRQCLMVWSQARNWQCSNSLDTCIPLADYCLPIRGHPMGIKVSHLRHPGHSWTRCIHQWHESYLWYQWISNLERHTTSHSEEPWPMAWASESKWQSPKHVQMQLDSVPVDFGLLSTMQLHPPDNTIQVHLSNGCAQCILKVNQPSDAICLLGIQIAADGNYQKELGTLCQWLHKYAQFLIHMPLSWRKGKTIHCQCYFTYCTVSTTCDQLYPLRWSLTLRNTLHPCFSVVLVIYATCSKALSLLWNQ